MVIVGFGRVGRIVADMLARHGRDYVAIDADTDAVRSRPQATGYTVLFGDVARGTLVERLKVGHAERGRADDGRSGAGQAA